jgi:hypothetical protein
MVYVDDIAVYGPDRPTLMATFCKVLDIMRDNTLYLKPSKCFSFVEKINCLGFVVSGNGLAMQSSKVEAVRNWEEPTTVKGVQRFLGFANCYRSFIPQFAKITKPLTDLIKKGQDFQWTLEASPPSKS